MNECLTTPQHENRSAIGCQNKIDAWNGYQIKNEWMNECLTTPQHENQSAIGCQNKVDAWNGYQIKNEWMNEWMFNDTPAQNINRLLGVRQMVS